MTHFRQGVPKLRDLAAGMENCCVVTTTEIAADFGKRKLRELLRQRHREAPPESRDETFLDAGNFLGIGIAGDYDLLVGLDQRIEEVEEFLLRPALAAEKLDVIDEQKVERAVMSLEVIERLVLIGADDIRHVSLGMDVAYSRVGIVLENVIADGLDEVGLSETDAPIHEEWVVRCWMLGNLKATCAGELIGLAGHKGIEGKPGIEARLLDAASRHGLGLRSGRVRRCASRGSTYGRVSDDKGKAQRTSNRDRGKLLDAACKAVLDPLQNKSVGRNQAQSFSG